MYDNNQYQQQLPTKYSIYQVIDMLIKRVQHLESGGVVINSEHPAVNVNSDLIGLTNILSSKVDLLEKKMTAVEGHLGGYNKNIEILAKKMQLVGGQFQSLSEDVKSANERYDILVNAIEQLEKELDEVKKPDTELSVKSDETKENELTMDCINDLSAELNDHISDDGNNIENDTYINPDLIPVSLDLA
jgi:hypothetical protein